MPIATKHSPRRSLGLFLTACAVLATAGCSAGPTGRPQLKLLPSEQVSQMGEAAYAQVRKQERVVVGTPVSRYIECVARAVTAVVPAPLGGDHWDISVFDSDQVNAFALPGGNIGVYTGLLGAARTPAQLAAVLGHEVAHVQAEHANSRLSAQYATEAGLSLVHALATGSVLDNQQTMGLLGLGAQVGLLLPFGRAQEREADVLGLTYMAKAGFEPHAALQLWQNMSEVSGPKGPTFLSTHPASSERIAALQTRMAEAEQQYQQARAAGRQPNCRAP